MVQEGQQHAAVELHGSLPVAGNILIVNLQVQIEHGAAGHGADRAPVEAFDKLITGIADEDQKRVFT